MSEKTLVLHCAPTLAGIKTGNLFSCTVDGTFLDDIRNMNHKLVPKGLRVLPVRVSKYRALVYVYRPQKLAEDFSECPVRQLLAEFGYFGGEPNICIVKLFQKLREEGDFPHEIGLFLGYPAEDVKGFVENKAKGCKCIGCWKVYGDEQAAREQFDRFRECTDRYCALWENGSPIEALAVMDKRKGEVL